MTFVASPVWIIVTEITPASIGRLLRADDGLEGLHHLARDRHRIESVVRHRRVRALPRIVILNSLRGRHHRPALEGEVADQRARPVVRAEDGLHRELVEQSVADHLAAPPPPSSAGWKTR